jgi:hypothetical protein
MNDNREIFEVPGVYEKRMIFCGQLAGINLFKVNIYHNKHKTQELFKSTNDCNLKKKKKNIKSQLINYYSCIGTSLQWYELTMVQVCKFWYELTSYHGHDAVSIRV